MDIYKRERSSVWWYWFRVDGKLVRRSTRRPLSDPEGARRVLADAYSKAMNVKQFGQKPETTLQDACQRVLARVKNSPKTLESYDLACRKFLGQDRFNTKDWFSVDPETPLSHLNSGDLEDLVTHRLDEGYANNSINIELRVIRTVVNTSAKRFAGPMDIEYPMLKHFEKTRFLSSDEEQTVSERLRMHVGSPAYDKASDLFTVLLDTGVRLREAIELQWPEVNRSLGQIEVYRTKTKSLSIVPITDRVAEILERKANQAQPFEEMSRAIRLLRGTISEVCNKSDRVIAQRGKATIHTCRDTYASRLVQNGMSLSKIAKLLGHTTPTMTRKYAHLEPADVADEARRILNG